MRRALSIGLSVAFSLLLGGEAMAKGVSIDVATAEQKANAQAAFENGVAAYKTGQVRAALEAFSQSYDSVASPNAHFMIAQCLADLGEPARAWNELLIVEDEAKTNARYAQTLDQSQKLRADLAPKVAVIEVSVEGGQATATAGGQDVPLDRPFAVAPGEVDVLAFVDGKSVRSVKVTAVAGQTKPVRFQLGAGAPAGDPTEPVTPENPDGPTSDSGVPYYVAGGVFAGLAVGAAVVGAVFEAKHKDTFDTLNTECADEPGPDGKRACPKEFADLPSDGETQFAVKTAGWIGAGVFAGASATMFIIGLTQPSNPDAASFDIAPGMRARVDVSPSGLLFSSGF